MMMMLFSIAAMSLQAQTVNIHKKDGTVIKVALQDFDYLEISGDNAKTSSTKTSSDSNRQQVATEKNASGVYNTDFNELTLTQTGNKVTGTYKHANGRIEGTINGRTLTGWWYQSNGKGRMVFDFNSDYSGFTGKWSYNDAQPSAKWDGTRIK